MASSIVSPDRSVPSFSSDSVHATQMGRSEDCDAAVEAATPSRTHDIVSVSLDRRRRRRR